MQVRTDDEVYQNKYIWSKTKNAKNLKEHGIDFKDAVKVFNDPFAIEDFDAANSIDEDRYNVTGLIDGRLVIIVTNTHFDQFNMIRIISARKTEPHERRKYDDNIKELIGV
jgi:uncharacterized DUF497 family protein